MKNSSFAHILLAVVILLTPIFGVAQGLFCYSDILYDPVTGLITAMSGTDVEAGCCGLYTGISYIDLSGGNGFEDWGIDTWLSVNAFDWGYGSYYVSTDHSVYIDGCDEWSVVGASYYGIEDSFYIPLEQRYPCPMLDQEQYVGTTEVSTDAGPIPTNFTWTETNLSDGSLSFTYTFDSTSGNVQDLQPCTAGETVWYKSNQDPYIWPLPMVGQSTNPTALYDHASNHFIIDRNRPPTSFRAPYFFADFTATQRLQWQCPWYKNGQFVSFVPDISIYRKVFQDTDHIWKYQITKTHGSTQYRNTISLP